MYSFSKQDIEQIKKKGISLNQIEYQINSFKKGFPSANLIAAATPKNGVLQLNDVLVETNINYFNEKAKNSKIVKFVPASGAASRMFKDLFEFRDALKTNEYEDLKKTGKYLKGIEFIENITKFAFYDDLRELQNNKTFNNKTELAISYIDLLLSEDGLNYANLPKALIKFHKYNDYSRKAIEEHLVEAAEYTKNKEGIANIHFTVSPNHLPLFKKEIENISYIYENNYNVNYNIDFSTQKSSTDTIAVDLNNEPFRENDGSLLFRPAGHGALIENLQEIDADIIFIKNIDNVAHSSKNEATIVMKKTLGGVALQIKELTFQLIRKLKQGTGIEESIEFIEKALGLEIDSQIITLDNENKAESLIYILNRPLRICGVVPNVGEPGGGPFWVDKNGKRSLQIVESAEIDQENDSQKKIMLEATHFNPVDLVCCTKDYQGNKFNLSEFVDHNAAFISEKSKDGKPLKAMELPGLWNGAMAFWNTIFIEVSIQSFNPVKTVNDLLRDMHKK